VPGTIDRDGGRTVDSRHHRGRGVAGWAILLGVVMAAPAAGRAAGPLETIRGAYRASSAALATATAAGTYRHYRAIGGGDWQLKQDADVAVAFSGRKYHIDLAFHRDALKRVTARRVVFDGEAITEAWFTPNLQPTGAQAFVSAPRDVGDGLSRPLMADFPWDVSRLSANVWDLDRLIGSAGAGSIRVEETDGGDLVATHRLIGGGWIRFECPRRFGYNVARLRHYNDGQEEPVRDVRVEWKRSPDGIWYVRSMDETRVLRDARNAVWRVREVLKYTEFTPNAKVDPGMFAEASLRLPRGSRILDGRVGAGQRVRVVP
jgi:hypothetical protein